jgi:hypothetical protein
MANIEAIVIEWLESIQGSSDNWPVSGNKPTTAPDQYILVDRTGGPREAMVLDRAEILIEVFDKNSRSAASEKANAIADAIPALLAYNDNITRAKVNSLVNLDDLLGQFHRYQLFVDVYYRR